MLGTSPEFFVARQSEIVDIVVFALAVLLVPTALVAALELAARLVDERVSYALHLVVVAALSTLFVLSVFKRVDDRATFVMLAAAAFAGALVAVSYRRPVVRTFLSLLALGPVLFLAVFLARAPLTDIAAAADVPQPVAAKRGVPVVFITFDEFPERR